MLWILWHKNRNGTYFPRLWGELDKVNRTKHLEQGLADTKCTILLLPDQSLSFIAFPSLRPPEAHLLVPSNSKLDHLHHLHPYLPILTPYSFSSLTFKFTLNVRVDTSLSQHPIHILKTIAYFVIIYLFPRLLSVSSAEKQHESKDWIWMLTSGSPRICHSWRLSKQSYSVTHLSIPKGNLEVPTLTMNQTSHQ